MHTNIGTALRYHYRTVLRSDSFNMVYRDEDSILDQVYKQQRFSDFYYKDLKF